MSGWIGLISLIIVGLMMHYSAHCIGYSLTKYRLESLPDIAEFAFGFTGRIVVSCLFYLLLLYDVAIFMALLSSIISVLASISNRLAQYLSFALFALVVNICRKNRFTSWLSILGNIASLLLFLVIVVVYIQRILDTSTDTNIKTCKVWETLHGLVESIGISA